MLQMMYLLGFQYVIQLNVMARKGKRGDQAVVSVFFFLIFLLPSEALPLLSPLIQNKIEDPKCQNIRVSLGVAKCKLQQT